MAASPNRLTAALATVAVIGGAGAACWLGASAAASFIETRSQEDVALALSQNGHDWARVSTDGLRVYLTGTAPTEVDRFRAMTEAASAVDSSRIIDRMTVAAIETLDPPDFEVELLRNDEGIQLIGLVPAATDRLAMVRMLRDETAAPEVTDLLEGADYPVPEGWQAALDFGLRVAQMASRSKISIGPGQVTVTALADSPAERARLETDLEHARPPTVALTTDITAPRPVIAPVTLRFLIDAEGGARFDACAADSDEARQRILAAASRAGAASRTDCTIGLGSPSPDWAEAAVAAIGALAALGSGTITLSDADVALIAPASVDPARFDEVVGRLEAALPAVFSLQAEHEKAQSTAAGPVEFTASVAADGSIGLRGRITDDRMRDAVESFARARYKALDSGLRTDPAVPGGWTVRVIAGLEALSALKSGAVTVTPELIRITGTSGDREASARAAADLSQRLGAGARYELAIRYDRRLDETLGLPDGEECVAALNTTMAESAIGFEPNKSTIAGDPSEALAALTATLKDCAEFQIEIGGHTDSQGSEGFNADLSRSRAQAILAAITEAGGQTVNLTARGYGEAQPIASNETEAGREANRRIEFRLLSELPVRSEPLPAPQVLSGITGSAPDPGTLAAAAPPPPAIQAAPIAPPPIAGGVPAGLAAPDDATPPIGAITDAAAAAQRPAPDLIGPPMPVTAPAVVGVAETARSGFLAEDETARLPVLTPDETTPRPAPRPGSPEAPAQDQQSDGPDSP